MNTLKAERRDMTIKAKKLRREGFVTGSIFGREMEETIPLKMEKGAVERLLKEEGKGGQVTRKRVKADRLCWSWKAGHTTH